MHILIHAVLKQASEELADLELEELAPKIGLILSELEARGVIPPSETKYSSKLQKELHEFAAERDMLSVESVYEK